MRLGVRKLFFANPLAFVLNSAQTFRGMSRQGAMLGKKKVFMNFVDKKSAVIFAFFVP